VPIIALGVVLLTIGIHGALNPRVSEKPAGLTTVAALTLLGSFALAFLAMFMMVLSVLAGAGIFGSPHALIPIFLGLFSYGAPIALFASKSSRYLWYAMTTFWIALFAYFCWWGYTFVWRLMGFPIYDWHYQILTLTILPLTYSTGCLLYFQKGNVKEYFHVKFATVKKPGKSETQPSQQGG
jgi:hypothetical protein